MTTRQIEKIKRQTRADVLTKVIRPQYFPHLSNAQWARLVMRTGAR